MNRKRSFGSRELPVIAQQAINTISQGKDVLAFLADKGCADPLKEWYDLRRWMKSNTPDLYAGIPMELRLELPAVNDNSSENTALEQEAEQQQEEKAPEEEPAAKPRKRAGRPSKAKPEETKGRTKTETEEKKRVRTNPRKRLAKVQIREVCGEAMSYALMENGSIMLIPRKDYIMLCRDDSEPRLVLSMEALKDLLDELPTVLKIFKA